MYANDRHPGLKKFREIRAKEKAIAILRNEIKGNNPDLSDSQVREIAQASYRAKNASMPKKRNHKRRSNTPQRRYSPNLSVKVEVLSNVKK